MVNKVFAFLLKSVLVIFILGFLFILSGTLFPFVPYVSVGNLLFELVLRATTFIWVSILLFAISAFAFKKLGGTVLKICTALGLVLVIGFFSINLSQYMTARKHDVNISLTKLTGISPPLTYDDIQTGDFVYSNVDGPKELTVYTPNSTSAAGHPVILYIHGGGWTTGDRHNASSFLKEFANAGYVAISISYSLATATKATWDIAPKQINEALSWINTHAADYQMDLDRFYMFGESAGGQLVTNTANRINDGTIEKELNEKVPTVKAVSVAVPAVNPKALYETTKLPVFKQNLYTLVTSYLGKDGINNPEVFNSVSSFETISSKTPPTFILGGAHDHIVPPSIVEDYYKQLKAAGIDTEYIKLPFADHATNTVYPNGVGYEMLSQLTLRWFNKYGSGI
ncbi:alpha/beta hydrolase [Saccharibacillus sp. CPCC 101409]|uniref:alpha/beta hydrolase n=1 Tax=Saccharibacillus sp. CPCC 101409 TaxID=3058041 RepID=UPI002672562A|nr:alpha/beta hydrolase [Saccharibacillus sp. CPCC 101409]MDO3408449.1 alpha/beta hydrolase [Saccharibacillus sp. CPCC 101409]